jgi:hypothetical protein
VKDRLRSSSSLAALAPRAMLLAALFAPAGCAAIYPELGTRIDKVAADQKLDPPPPDGLRWLQFEKGEVPPTTRDGRKWGRGIQDGLPDPVAKLFVNEVEVLKTDPAPKTINPSYEGSKHGNFALAVGDKIRLELWDSDPLNNRPIGTGSARVTPEMLADGQYTARFDMGGQLTLSIKPAKAVWGLGLWYEVRGKSAGITRVLGNSPATRAGLKKGDEIVAIGPTQVSDMTTDEVRSAMNAPPFDGLALTVRHADGATLDAKVKQGPIYATFAEYGPVD